MGNELSTARIAAPAAFIINLGAQIYGLVSDPNMKQVADSNHYAFSPNPAFIGGFFFPQMILQAAWIRKLLMRDDIEAEAIEYTPIYVLGNLCISGWMLFWNKEKFWLSQALVTINSLSQLYAVSRLPPMTSENALTHLVAKTTAGIGILDFVDNGAVALQYVPPPSAIVKILTGAFFAAASAAADPILGASIVYDLTALYSGQEGSWGTTLGWYALGSAVIVGVKSILM